MSTPSRFGSAISLAAMASMAAGCAAPQARTAAASNFGGKLDENIGLATRALAALNSNNVPAAIDLAERAVARTPSDAGYRGLLGNAYFAGGRFWSAEAAYKDSLSIYSNQPKVVLKLALVEIALGKKDEAVAFLTAARDVLEPADYGLALALAGRSADAIPVLEAAARANGSDPRVRQNLALAYAFAGDWAEARTVAAQDVPADQLDARISQWMQLASPKRASDQVAALVGVTPSPSDQGQPIRLALRRTDQRLAEASPAPAPAPVIAPVAASSPRVVAAPEPVAAPQFAAAPPASPPAPVVAVAPPPPPPRVETEAALPAPVTTVLLAAAAHVRSAISAFLPRNAPAAVKPRPRSVAKAQRPPLNRGNAPTVVQLGAYGSPERVLAAWNSTARKYGALKAYRPMSARFDSSRGTFYRLSVKGFASTGEANALCASLRRSGGSCFVRHFAGDAPVQYASR